MGVTPYTDHLLVKMIIGRRFRFRTPHASTPRKNKLRRRRRSKCRPSHSTLAWQRSWVCSFPPSAHTRRTPKPARRRSLLRWALPAIPWPADNPYSLARAELGKLLFFDGRLAADGEVSCAFCHQPEHGFAGGSAFSVGVSGKPEARHTPTIINRAWGRSQFWDGRAETLEAQVRLALTNPDEMGMTEDAAAAKIRAISGYAPLFAAAFGDSTISFERIAKAIATFERTIVSGNSAYDRYLAGDKSALTPQQKDGLDFFNKKGECAECHSGPELYRREVRQHRNRHRASEIPIPAARLSPRSAAIPGDSRCPRCATSPAAPPTCTTVANARSLTF